MPTAGDPLTARADTSVKDGVMVVALSGRWRITGSRPSWAASAPRGDLPPLIRFDCSGVESWDSSLVLFLREAAAAAEATGSRLQTDDLPGGIQRLLGLLRGAEEKRVPKDRSKDFLSYTGLAADAVWRRVRELYTFVGECLLSAVYLLRNPSRFRVGDWLEETQQCGAMALPIVSLVSFLVGLTLAYTGAVILRQFGGDIWVADLVSLSMVREMGPVMTGVVLSGRTGAAFAARLANMKANEEIDALETLGIRPVDFLVMPRIAALVVMMPLLAMYANFLGMFGGMVVALGLLDIPPAAYWVETQTIVDMSDLATGFIKSVAFGGIVALSGCLRGLQADRSAAGVGNAATSAVVTSILLIIVADAAFAVVFNILGW
jgi:phospholipid/cholesterol/gamma-HCH transport system permease protein